MAPCGVLRQSSVVIAACLLLFIAPSTSGFLFPDVTFRTGTGAAKYRIAVLQQEPYLYKNGSGYIPELMRQIAVSHKSQHDEDLPYDIVPVTTWQQLMSRARTSRWQVAFGLNIPSLELTNWVGRSLPVSMPTLYTTLKAVTRRNRNQNVDVTSGQLQLDEHMTLITLKASPVEHLLIRANKYRGSTHAVNSVEEAVELLHTIEGSVLLTDAGTADYVVSRSQGDLQAVCSQHIPGSGMVFYGFFGKDAAMMKTLNDAILRLISDESLLSLYARYFAVTTQCTL